MTEETWATMDTDIAPKALLWLYQCKREHICLQDGIDELRKSMKAADLAAVTQEQIDQCLRSLNEQKNASDFLNSQVETLRGQIDQGKAQHLDLSELVTTFNDLRQVLEHHCSIVKGLLEKIADEDSNLKSFQDGVLLLHEQRMQDFIMMKKFQEFQENLQKQIESLQNVNMCLESKLDAQEQRISEFQLKVNPSIGNRFTGIYHDSSTYSETFASTLGINEIETEERPTTLTDSSLGCITALPATNLLPISQGSTDCNSTNMSIRCRDQRDSFGNTLAKPIAAENTVSIASIENPTTHETTPSDRANQPKMQPPKRRTSTTNGAAKSKSPRKRPSSSSSQKRDRARTKRDATIVEKPNIVEVVILDEEIGNKESSSSAIPEVSKITRQPLRNEPRRSKRHQPHQHAQHVELDWHEQLSQSVKR